MAAAESRRVNRCRSPRSRSRCPATRSRRGCTPRIPSAASCRRPAPSPTSACPHRMGRCGSRRGSRPATASARSTIRCSRRSSPGGRPRGGAASAAHRARRNRDRRAGDQSRLPGAVLRHDAYQAGAVATAFVEANAAELLAPAPPADDRRSRIASLWLLCRQRRDRRPRWRREPRSPFALAPGRRLAAERRRPSDLAPARGRASRWRSTCGPTAHGWRLRIGAAQMRGERRPRRRRPARGGAGRGALPRSGSSRSAISCTCSRRWPFPDRAGRPAGARRSGGRGGRRADRADAGQDRATAGRRRRSGGRGAPLLVLEAMKMEHTIVAPSDGRILRSTTPRAIRSRKAPILIDFEPTLERPA